MKVLRLPQSAVGSGHLWPRSQTMLATLADNALIKPIAREETAAQEAPEVVLVTETSPGAALCPLEAVYKLALFRGSVLSRSLKIPLRAEAVEAKTQVATTHSACWRESQSSDQIGSDVMGLKGRSPAYGGGHIIGAHPAGNLQPTSLTRNAD